MAVSTDIQLRLAVVVMCVLISLDHSESQGKLLPTFIFLYFFCLYLICLLLHLLKLTDIIVRSIFTDTKSNMASGDSDKSSPCPSCIYYLYASTVRQIPQQTIIVPRKWAFPMVNITFVMLRGKYVTSNQLIITVTMFNWCSARLSFS